MFEHLQLANRSGDMANGSRSLPFHYKGMTSDSKDCVQLTAVIIAYTNVNVLSKLGDTKDFYEALNYPPDSNGFAWDLHNCFYTLTCAFAQVKVFMQILAVVDFRLQRRIGIVGRQRYNHWLLPLMEDLSPSHIPLDTACSSSRDRAHIEPAPTTLSLSSSVSGILLRRPLRCGPHLLRLSVDLHHARCLPTPLRHDLMRRAL